VIAKSVWVETVMTAAVSAVIVKDVVVQISMNLGMTKSSYE